MGIKSAALALAIIASSVSALDYVLVQEYLAPPEISQAAFTGNNVLEGLDCLGKIPASLCEEYKGYILSSTEKYFPYRCASKFSPQKFAVVIYFQAQHESAKTWNKNAYLAADPKKGIILASHGLMQFTEDTSNYLGIGKAGAYEPRIAIPAAVKYMASFLTNPKTGCNYGLALAAYNAGPKYIGTIPQNRWTPNYVGMISSEVESYWRSVQLAAPTD
ncbi:MAG: lytic transglycosylase domain-containing protein [Candidatus Micrarchaeota archaeon]